MATDTVTVDQLSTLITQNLYIQQSVSRKSKDTSSLSSLIIRSLSQSDCIKLGTGIEKLLVDLILSHSTLKLVNIKPKNTKGQKERDHLFLDAASKTIYYAELKSNINLDTEKSRSTYQKCQSIVGELQREYPDHKIEWCLLALRYLDYTQIPVVIQKKYSPIHPHLCGINQYLDTLNIPLEFTEDSYSTFLNQIADKMFEKQI